MKLSQALTQINKPVKIGTMQGSGFVFIGKAEDALKKLEKIRIGDFKRDPKDEVYVRIPWPERKVIETYESSKVIDDCLIVIIEGAEVGGRWFLGDTPIFAGRAVKEEKDKVNSKTKVAKKAKPKETAEPTAEPPKRISPLEAVFMPVRFAKEIEQKGALS